MTPKATLAFYVDDFKKWRQENYSEQQISINATDDPSYPKWDDLESYFSHLLDTRQFSQLDKEDKINLLYLISRGFDNAAFLSELTENRPISTRGDLTDEDFIELAKISTFLVGAEYDDGKASIAMCFRKFEYLTPEIESILLNLYADDNEYTKRQALFALAKLSYKGTIALVEKSWSIDDEWHKIGCLSVLDEYINDKTQLTNYLKNAANYGGQDLAEHVQQLRRKNNC
jgi:hypothetical protein